MSESKWKRYENKLKEIIKILVKWWVWLEYMFPVLIVDVIFAWLVKRVTDASDWFDQFGHHYRFFVCQSDLQSKFIWICPGWASNNNEIPLLVSLKVYSYTTSQLKQQHELLRESYQYYQHYIHNDYNCECKHHQKNNSYS